MLLLQIKIRRFTIQPLLIQSNNPLSLWQLNLPWHLYVYLAEITGKRLKKVLYFVNNFL